MIDCYSLIITSFIARKVSINDVTQLCYTTRVCPRPLGCLAILFFILSYLSYLRSSSFEVDLPLSEALSSVMVSLTLGASNSCLLEWILNCHHLFFGTSLILLFLNEAVQYPLVAPPIRISSSSTTNSSSRRIISFNDTFVYPSLSSFM